MLAELAALSLCTSHPNFNQEACNKFATATMMQLEWKQGADKAELYFTEHAEAYTGAAVWVLGGITYRVVKSKEFHYQLKTKKFMPIDYVDTKYKYGNGQEGGSLGIGWSF